jgi:ABC-type polysaccharide/polyol phosphate transport system ATPase subunit
MAFVSVKNLKISYHTPKHAGTFFTQADPWQNESEWQLEPMSFQLQPGQGLGLVGENGSGKSSCLKALAGVIPSISDELILPENTLTALDLNLFFHQDFSGFDNLFMMNACFAKSDRELEAVIDNIIQFSELEDFIHRPVREYSTGMRMRLGVSYVLFQDFDCLLIDEVLSVGDEAFQRKSNARLKTLLAQGKSIVLASHNMNEVVGLCQNIFLLDKGKILKSGAAEDVIAYYFSRIDEKAFFEKIDFEDSSDPELKQGGLEIKNVRILNQEGEESSHFASGDYVRFEVTVSVTEAKLTDLLMRIEFFRNDGLFVSGMNNYRKGFQLDLDVGEATIFYEIHHLNLLSSVYYISLSFWLNEYASLVSGEFLDIHDKRHEITVVSSREQGAGVARIESRFGMVGLED